MQDFVRALEFDAGNLLALLGAAKASRTQTNPQAEQGFLRSFLNAPQDRKHPARDAVEGRLAELGRE